MCGICGAITQPNPNIIKSLMIANERRGDKSTGIAYRIGEQTSVFKDVLPSSKFVKRIPDAKINSANLVICHTRMPSVGLTVSKKNAHPFRYNNVVGVHNGTVSNHADIKHSGEVDSQAIFHLLSLKKNNFVEVFPELQGSMAVAWVVDNDPNLYLLRHISPLFIAKSQNTLYFNSEELVLQSSLAGAGIDVEIDEVDEDMVYTITPSLEITKTKVSFKSYYVAPTYNESTKEKEEDKKPASTFIYPNGERKSYGLAPEYTFPPTSPSSAPPLRGVIVPPNHFYADPWDGMEVEIDTRSETKRAYDAMFNRKGPRAKMEMNKVNPNNGLWSMKQILENYRLFNSDGKVNKKVMNRKARNALQALLGPAGYNLIKEVKTDEEFAKAMMDGFGRNLCHIVCHHGFWFVKKTGFVFCSICANNNQTIRNGAEYIVIK